MRQVLVVTHRARAAAVRLAARFCDDLRAAGVRTCVLADEQDALHEAGHRADRAIESREGAAEGCELTVVFGGDGSILRAAELVRSTATPVLGVNLGRVGFLAEADAEDVHHVVRGVLARDYTVDERLTVDVSVDVDGTQVATNWALNEASVEKAARERMLEVVVAIDDHPISRWGCDGVVFATPTGSTAYNFSAGGPVVWPEVSALLLVPISAHALFARPMVVSPDSVLTLAVVGEASSGVLWCDGRRAADLPLGARVTVRRGAEPVRLARLRDAPFADRLVRKFHLPVTGWRGIVSS